MRRTLSFIIMLCMIIGIFAGCGEKETSGRVYYLNFKPEQDSAWQELAKAYTDETGVEVKVVTAAQGTYEQTLLAEIDKDEAPTLFQVNGPVGLESWKDYCMDLSGTKVYSELISDDFALKEKSKVYAIAYVYESYGLITNKKLLEKAGYEIDEITSFEKLKEVAESITKRKKELGFSAFTSSGLASASSWRFAGHLANLPLYYEFKDRNITGQASEIKGTYVDNFKKVWDLYINNSTIDPKTITSDQNDATAEFKAEKAVFYQNGTWEYENVKSIGEDNLGFLPIYVGIDDSEQGLCSGTENYWSVNAEASKADQQATLEFINWVVTSDKGTTSLAEKMGFVAPFKKAKTVNNKLSKIASEYVDKGHYSVTWAFNTTPNVDVWRGDLVDALASYSAGKGSWDAVKKAFVEGWKEQYEASKQ
ncbi:MAG: ABC transporter substrate-binding protein [Acutalibacteraceae bacterium]|nr:ABC transporter substrate-binding protein [Acutalibacteraceae bacterium]